jgi:hypothetical protein
LDLHIFWKIIDINRAILISFVVANKITVFLSHRNKTKEENGIDYSSGWISPADDVT